jgi:hypothetical protein
MYELVAVLALASSYFMLRVIGDASARGGARPQIAYFVFTALALYTHYSAFFILAAQNIFALLRLRGQRAALLRWLALQVLLIATYVPWIIVQTSFLRGKASARFDEWGWRGIEMIFGKTFLAFGAGLTMEFPFAQITAAAFLLLAALGAYAIVRRRESPAWFAPLYFVAPVVIAYVINPIMPFFFERYALVALPGFIVTVALGVDFIAARRARAAIGIASILILFNASSLWNYFIDDAYAKGKYGQMMTHVTRHAQPGDALVLNNPLQKPLYRYYAPRDLPAFFLPDGAPLEDPSTRAQLEEIAREHSRVWLVMFGNPAEYDPTGYLERWLGANAFKTFADGFVDARLSLYVMPRATPAIRREARYALDENIRLVGFDLERAQVAPGETLLLTLRWQATAPVSNRYQVFTHLIGALNPATQSPVWAQMDGEPVGGSRPTNAWQIGETIDDRYGLQVPRDTPPGEYQIEIGMYDPVTLARLPVRDASGNRIADDRILLITVQVGTR